MELARMLFVSLQRDTFYRGRYLILNDQNYITSFYADNDADAIQYFYSKEWKTGL